MKKLHFITGAIFVFILITPYCLLAGEMVVDAWHLSDDTQIEVILTYIDTDGHQEFYQVPFSIPLIDTIQYMLDIPSEPGELTFHFYEKYWWEGGGWEPHGSPTAENTIFISGWEECALSLFYIGGEYEISFTDILNDVCIGSVLSIEWAADSGVQATSSVIIELSRNGGVSWSDLDEVAYDSNGSEYEWVADLPESDVCKIRLKLSDYAGNQSTAISNTFSIMVDSDYDGIADDGDRSGIAGDHPCTGGNTTNCDDNCLSTANSDQADADSDGVGSVCDNCTMMSNNDQADSIGDGRGDVCDFFNNSFSLPYSPAHPMTICISDVNGDFKNDIISTDSWSDMIGIYINNGDSSFRFDRTYSLEDKPRRSVAVDLDNDNDVDIATVNEGSHNISILKNTGDGSFDPPVSYGLVEECSPQYLCFGRFDSDNHVDLAVSCPNDGVKVLSNEGDGTFGDPAGYLSGVSCNTVLAVDVNGNDVADIVIGTTYGFEVLFNNGIGIFSSSQDYLWGGSIVDAITASDIDGDNDYDVILRTDSFIVAFLNDGLGAFIENGIIKTVDSYSRYSTPVVSHDFDGDRDNDLIIAKSNGLFAEVELLVNNGQGIFNEWTTFGSVWIWPYDLAVGDLDGDYSGDLVVTSQRMSSFYSHVFLNKKPIAYVCGDANSDGNANVGDAVYLISYIFQGGPPPNPIEAGDANCDGIVNVGDAVYLISYIFKGGQAPCCP